MFLHSISVRVRKTGDTVRLCVLALALLKVPNVRVLGNINCKISYQQAIRVRNEKLTFLFLSQKHMLWVLKRTVSMRRFFWAPKTYVKIDG